MPRFRLVAAIFAAGLASAPIAAHADAVGENIHLALGTNEFGAPKITFIFSDGTASGYNPLEAFSVELDVNRICVADFDAQWTGLEPGEIIYGPGSERRFGENKDRTTIDFEKLPSYFAREAVSTMLDAGAVADEKNAIPYFNCVGKVWATVLTQERVPQ